jgi:hypothetical protein
MEGELKTVRAQLASRLQASSRAVGRVPLVTMDGGRVSALRRLHVCRSHLNISRVPAECTKD